MYSSIYLLKFAAGLVSLFSTGAAPVAPVGLFSVITLSLIALIISSPIPINFFNFSVSSLK